MYRSLRFWLFSVVTTALMVLFYLNVSPENAEAFFGPLCAYAATTAFMMILFGLFERDSPFMLLGLISLSGALLCAGVALTIFPLAIVGQLSLLACLPHLLRAL